MTGNKHIAAIVVLYHPAFEDITNAISHGAYLEQVIIVDNTDCLDIPDSCKLLSNSNVTYVPLGENYGVAHALNIGVEKAVEMGCDWAILMDQDSRLEKSVFDAIEAHLSPSIGIASPLQVSRQKNLESTESVGLVDVPVTMTSGSILNLKAYAECGPLDAKLFIDYVDFEYCLRLRKCGYRVVQCMDAHLKHALGETRLVSFLGHKLEITSHKPFRLYFIIRNGFYVACRYFLFSPTIVLSVMKTAGTELVKTILFEDQKWLRLKMMVWGLNDWLRNRYGRRFV
jgi:rhamnosyltransferase